MTIEDQEVKTARVTYRGDRAGVRLEVDVVATFGPDDDSGLRNWARRFDRAEDPPDKVECAAPKAWADGVSVCLRDGDRDVRMPVADADHVTLTYAGEPVDVRLRFSCVAAIAAISSPDVAGLFGRRLRLDVAPRQAALDLGDAKQKARELVRHLKDTGTTMTVQVGGGDPVTVGKA